MQMFCALLLLFSLADVEKSAINSVSQSESQSVGPARAGSQFSMAASLAVRQAGGPTTLTWPNNALLTLMENLRVTNIKIQIVRLDSDSDSGSESDSVCMSDPSAADHADRAN